MVTEESVYSYTWCKLYSFKIMKNWSDKDILSPARPWILYPAGFFLLYGRSRERYGETIQCRMP